MIDREGASSARSTQISLHPHGSGSACVPATLLLLFGNLDQIVSFKVGAASIEAKLTEKISDAQRILDQLNAVAVNTAKSLIQGRENSSALTANNDFPRQDAFKASIIQMLKDEGQSLAAIDEVEQSDSNVVIGFYSNAAFRFGSDGFLPDEKKTSRVQSGFLHALR